MKPVISFFGVFMSRLFRDKFALFWLLVFPMFLLGILILIFGNVTGGPDSFETQVVLVDNDGGEIAEILVNVLETISGNENSWLILSQTSDLEEAKKGLFAGDFQAIFRIADSFSQDVMANVGGQFMGQEEVIPGRVEILWREGVQMSNITATALEQVVESFAGELYLETGLMLPTDRVEFNREMAQPDPEEGTQFNYVNYIVPGIILMAFLSTGLDELVTNMTSPRDKGILRRYFATPLKSSHYIGGLLLYIMVIALVQLVIIYLFGTRVFSARIELWSPLPMFFVVFSLLVLLAVGLLIAAVAKNADSAGRLSNIVFYPMMFLGGLYFPIEGMPGPIQLISDINPITYLSNGLRESLGVFSSPTSMEMNIIVPLIWLIAGVFIGVKRFKWYVAK